MKIDNKSLKFANQNLGNKPLPIPFYVPDSEKKIEPFRLPDLQATDQSEGQEVSSLQPGGKVLQNGNP
eukprot:9966279-Ditylum_brightwellii.AAC.1